jgi:hypothetical protein
MDPDFAQRRRVAVAVAITVILVPAAALLSRGDDSTGASPQPTVVGTAAAAGAPSTVPPANEPSATDAMGTTAIDAEAGLDEPVVEEQARIAIPRPPRAIVGTATFRNDILRTTVCQVGGVKFNTQVTITNLDNSKSVRCFAAVRGDDPNDDVVLHVDAFLQIADITDAPIPVQITW